MKLTSIDLYSNNQEVASLSFKDPGATNRYIVQSTTGLDADEIVPKYNGRSGKTGNGFFNLSLIKRDIVVLVSLNPQFSAGKSYSDLRDDLYRAIYSSRDGSVELQFKNGKKTVASITGFISKFETNLFAKTPQVQLTVHCDEGLILSPDETSINAFELGYATTFVDYISTAPHGFQFEVTFDAPSATFVIKSDLDTVPDWKFEVAYSFLTGDKLFYSSITGEKTLYIVRGGVTINLVDKILIGSMWPIMFPGTNDFFFATDGGFTWNTCSYYNSYWGI